METPKGDKPQVYRSVMGTVMGWTWAGLAAFFLADIVWRGRDLASLVAASALLLVIAAAYVIGVRPRIVATEEGVRLHNPLRDVWVPWSAVEKIDVTDAVRVHSAGRPYRAWVLQTSPRARARAMQRHREDRDRVPDKVAEELRGRTPADHAAERLTELADSRRGPVREAGGATAPSVTWSWPSVAGLALPALLCAVTAVLAATLSG
jgi:hypothetical protein